MYGVNASSDAISRDMNSVFYSSTFKHPPDGDLISSDPYPNFNHQTQQDETYQRSFFSNLLNYNGDDDFTTLTDSFITHQQPKSESEQVRNEHHIKKQLQDATPSSINHSRRVSASSNLDSAASSFRPNLVRQNSTPPGFLSSLTPKNGFASMKTGSSSSTLNNHASFSLGPSSSPSRFLPQIAENKNDLQDSKYSSLKRSRDGVLKMPQNGEAGNHTPNLVHHMSLPKTSSEMAVVENLLQFQQESTVPWKTRAKRGFATHPRSIAERVRRTRISERIKRLQELFPDLDKQSNTADMLDMAVEYIKNLQKELQTLNDARARCKCPSKQL